MNVTAVRGDIGMERKIISISSKRQITIPQKFYNLLGFDGEAECLIRDNELVIRPARINSDGEFAEQILEDLVAQGFSGDELLKAFKEKRAKVRPAVEAMLEVAGKVAAGKEDYVPYEDVFASED